MGKKKLENKQKIQSRAVTRLENLVNYWGGGKTLSSS